jgi:hypothetical protein
LKKCDTLDAFFENEELKKNISNNTLKFNAFYFCAPKEARESIFVGTGPANGLNTMNAYRVTPCDDAWNAKHGIKTKCLPKD